MFCTGTHAKEWTFKTEGELLHCRKRSNESYIRKFMERTGASSVPDFLSATEEKLLYKYFEFALHEFCKKFKPPMPKSVISCSFNYYKRFYLNNSVMDYHPKHIIVTCVFLACKVEEFNVSITQFVANVKGDRSRAKEIILSHELLLMQQCTYNLFIHHPYRPVEGFLIDIKTRCPQIHEPERFRHTVEEFLDQICFTDAFLLYAPSQIALAAIAYAGTKFKENLIDSFIINVLYANGPEDKLRYIIEAIKKMWYLVKNIDSLPKDKVKAVEKKLEKCRNEENNPNSVIYKRRLEELQEEDEVEQTKKYMKLAEKQSRDEEELLGAVRADM